MLSISRALVRTLLEFGKDGYSVILDKPESIMWLSGIIFDALAFCQDDGNFKRERGGKGEVVEG